MLTLSLILVPAFAAVAVLFVPPAQARWVALAGALAELLLAAAVFIHFQANADFQYGFDYGWLFNAANGTGGLRFSGAVDGISLLPVVLTGLVTPLILSSTLKQTYPRPNTFYALILFMQAALMGVFVARDGFLFYFFFEAALIPIYFLAAIWGGENRVKVTFKFFLYTIFGSLLMLVALVFLYANTPLTDGVHSAALADFYALNLNPTQQGFIIKVLNL